MVKVTRLKTRAEPARDKRIPIEHGVAIMTAPAQITDVLRQKNKVTNNLSDDLGKSGHDGQAYD